MPLSRTVPALPVRDVAAALVAYRERLGFLAQHAEHGFAIVRRDEAELHLWAASDDDWRDRTDLAARPVCSGAESFLAGTASCRVQLGAVVEVDVLHAELRGTGALHPIDPGHPTDTAWGTRELDALDLDGNLLTFFATR